MKINEKDIKDLFYLKLRRMDLCVACAERLNAKGFEHDAVVTIIKGEEKNRKKI